MIMKNILVLAALFLTSPAFAETEKVAEKKTYRPFRYETPCGLETANDFLQDNCVVIETRETGGALRTRNIYSNRFGLTIKGRFDKEKGYMTWDSHNKYEYKWEYKPAGTGWTYVMPGVLVQNISWD
jgi:hypothetical protein